MSLAQSRNTLGFNPFIQNECGKEEFCRNALHPVFKIALFSKAGVFNNILYINQTFKKILVLQQEEGNVVYFGVRATSLVIWLGGVWDTGLIIRVPISI